jgi:hypothetical protein
MNNIEKELIDYVRNELMEKAEPYKEKFSSLLDTLPEDSEGYKKWECPIPITLLGVWGNIIFSYDILENNQLHEQGACEYLQYFDFQFKPTTDPILTARAQSGG